MAEQHSGTQHYTLYVADNTVYTALTTSTPVSEINSFLPRKYHQRGGLWCSLLLVCSVVQEWKDSLLLVHTPLSFV